MTDEELTAVENRAASVATYHLEIGARCCADRSATLRASIPAPDPAAIVAAVDAYGRTSERCACYHGSTIPERFEYHADVATGYRVEVDATRAAVLALWGVR